MSTNVGLFFAAAFPPALNSGNPGRVRSYGTKTEGHPISQLAIVVNRFDAGSHTLDKRSSVRTLQTSL